MKNKMLNIFIAAMLVLPTTSCGSTEAPTKQESSASSASSADETAEVTEISDNSEPAAEDTTTQENATAEPVPLDDEVFTNAMEYVNSNFFTSTDDGFIFTGSTRGISSDSIWYSDPFMLYETDDAEQVSTSDAYAFFVIDKDNDEVVGFQMIVDGEPANGSAIALEECYTEALVNSTPIAMVSWNRGENFATIFCVADGKVISTDSDADKLVNAENFYLYYSAITPAHPSAPTA